MVSGDSPPSHSLGPLALPARLAAVTPDRQTRLKVEDDVKRGPGVPFLIMGIAFISLGISGQRAFIAIGGAFLALGAALLFRQRRNHEQ